MVSPAKIERRDVRVAPDRWEKNHRDKRHPQTLGDASPGNFRLIDQQRVHLLAAHRIRGIAQYHAGSFPHPSEREAKRRQPLQAAQCLIQIAQRSFGIIGRPDL